MNKAKYKPGDIVSVEFREAYDREWHLSLVVEVNYRNNNYFYKVYKIDQRLGGNYVTNNWMWRPEKLILEVKKPLSLINHNE